MKNRKIERVVTFAGIGVIGALIAFMIFLQVENAKNSDFLQKYEKIVIDTNSLTTEYQTEEGRWKAKQYDNSTMISIVDSYLPEYQELIDRAQSLDTPERYQDARRYLVLSIEAEMQSNVHFRNYLDSGDQAEYQKSVELLSESLQHSANADAAIKSG